MATTTKSSLLSSSSPSTITFSQNQKELEKSVAKGLDVILFHLKEPTWPRTISTKTTEGRQVPVYNKPEALAWYKAANFFDGRISAYPYDVSFILLDEADFFPPGQQADARDVSERYIAKSNPYI